MMWIHPIWQLAALVFSLQALWLGWRRVAMVHLGRKGQPFAWKRHVRLGALALGLCLAGLGLGFFMANWSWDVLFLTGLHYQLALVMLPLMAFGLISGYVMDKRKAKRKLLPLAHGLANIAMVALSLAQVVTGAQVLREMVLP